MKEKKCCRSIVARSKNLEKKILELMSNYKNVRFAFTCIYCLKRKYFSTILKANYTELLSNVYLHDENFRGFSYSEKADYLFDCHWMKRCVSVFFLLSSSWSLLLYVSFTLRVFCDDVRGSPGFVSLSLTVCCVRTVVC